MPSQLPLRLVVTGLLATVWRHARFAGRLALVAACWLLIVPFVVTYNWTILFPSDWTWTWDGRCVRVTPPTLPPRHTQSHPDVVRPLNPRSASFCPSPTAR